MNWLHWRVTLALGAAPFCLNLAHSAFACDAGCMPRGMAMVPAPVPAAASAPVESPQTKLSWVFRRSTYTNDPITGARVGQFARKDPVEPLDDQRLVTSSYRRMRSENRGRDGSIDTTYVVQGWGDGGGELDAQWQMFNDVWKEAILSGSFYNNQQAYGPWGSGRWGWNNWNGGPVWGNPPWNGGWQNGGWNGGGWNGGWNGGGNQGNWPHGGPHDNHWPSDDRPPLNQD